MQEWLRVFRRDRMVEQKGIPDKAHLVAHRVKAGIKLLGLEYGRIAKDTCSVILHIAALVEQMPNQQTRLNQNQQY